MDNTQSTTPSTPVNPQVSNINYSPMPPQTPPSTQVKKGIWKNIVLIVVFVLLIGAAIAGISYFYFLQTPKTYNASVYTPPKTTKAGITPTPTGSQINQNDKSNNALSSDSSIINKDINSTSSDLSGVDQSFTDQQTNLQ